MIKNYRNYIWFSLSIDIRFINCNGLVWLYIEPTPKHYESDYKLQKFNRDPKKFKISVGLALFEHFYIIVLAVMLFLVMSPYSIMLGIVCNIFRGAEGAIQVYIEKDYWKLLNIAERYSDASNLEKTHLMESYKDILKTKSMRFLYAIVGWAVGTFALSIVLVTYALVIPFIGWFGLIVNILIGFANGMILLKPEVKAYEALSTGSGMLAILFEILIGIALIWFPPVIT